MLNSKINPEGYAVSMISSPKFTETLFLPFSIKSFLNKRNLDGNSSFITLPPWHNISQSITRQISHVLKKHNTGYDIKADVVHPASENYIEEAIDAVKAEKVIAVPTDTLYGFACDACSAQAVNKIYEIKGRINTKPLAICVADVSDIQRFASVEHLPFGLLSALLPGPVTLVLRRDRSSILDKSLNPGIDSIGVRIPDCDFVRAVARGSGSALALTSANFSGHPSSVSITDFVDLWKYCEYVFDVGILPLGRAGSTVVDLTSPRFYKILRSGSARDETVAVLHHFHLEEAF